MVFSLHVMYEHVDQKLTPIVAIDPDIFLQRESTVNAQPTGGREQNAHMT